MSSAMLLPFCLSPNVKNPNSIPTNLSQESVFIQFMYHTILTLNGWHTLLHLTMIAYQCHAKNESYKCKTIIDGISIPLPEHSIPQNPQVPQLKLKDHKTDSFLSTGGINTLRPGQNGRDFPDDHLKCIFLNENIWITLKISLKFVPEVQINNIPALVQIMAWRRPGDKQLSEPMMVSLLTHICVTRPQWVKGCRNNFQP